MREGGGELHSPIQEEGMKTLSRLRDALGEGPWWSVQEQRLYWVDILGRTVQSSALDGGDERRWPTATEVGFAIPDGEGRAVIGLRDGLHRLDLASGGVEPIEILEADRPDQRFNDGKCDRQGRLWFGSMHDSADIPVGSLYRWESRSGCERVLRGIRTSNGLGWSPDGRLMYYTDSPTRRISVWDYDPTVGVASSGRTFARDPNGWLPDGMTVDAEGGVWSAKWDGGVVVRYRPDGVIDRVLDMPVRRPTSCMFAGPDLRTLVVTSASHGTDGDAGLAGAVFLVDVEIPGLPEAAPTCWSTADSGASDSGGAGQEMRPP